MPSGQVLKKIIFEGQFWSSKLVYLGAKISTLQVPINDRFKSPWYLLINCLLAWCIYYFLWLMDQTSVYQIVKIVISIQQTFLTEGHGGFLRLFNAMSKVDCSGERLSVFCKNLRILKTFSSYQLIKTRGTQWNLRSLYQCIGRKCFQNPQIFATNPQSFSRAIYFIKSFIYYRNYE
jgi:hypothetical protein